jgi:DNA-binding transcriptional ArsR family regulator
MAPSILKGICGGSCSACAIHRHAEREVAVDQRSAKPGLDAAFAALSDSSRREMIRMLLQRPRRAGELAGSVEMSPQALSRHLRVLRRAGLITEEGIEDDARVRVYSVHPAAFQPVQQWLAQIEELWRGQLHAFKSYAESSQRGRKLKS